MRIFGGQSNDNETFDGVGGQGGYDVAQVELFGTPAVAGVPQPGSMALLGAALLGLIGLGRRRIGWTSADATAALRPWLPNEIHALLRGP